MTSWFAMSSREEVRELAAVDALCEHIFHLFEAFPRLKDTVVDAVRAEALGEGADLEARGALVLRGPPKMLQTVAMITSKHKAPETAVRFKPLASRCKWVPAAELAAALEGATGLEGLPERVGTYGLARQYVTVVAVEAESGVLRCQHTTGTGNADVDDRGPWEYVLDHGRDRCSSRPKFGYNGSLAPHRVSPDRPVPANVVKPDWYETGEAEAERRSDQRHTPICLDAKAAAKMRKVNILGREILDVAHRAVRPGVTTDEIDRVVHEFTVENGAYPLPLHYFNFPKSVCTSVNEARTPSLRSGALCCGPSAPPPRSASPLPSPKPRPHPTRLRPGTLPSVPSGARTPWEPPTLTARCPTPTPTPSPSPPRPAALAPAGGVPWDPRHARAGGR